MNNRLHVTNKNIQILGYNIAGIKNKLNNVTFLNFVHNYDVICLFETHLESDNSKIQIENYFSDYCLYCEPAGRCSRYGRASGGKVYGFKKWLKKEKLCNYITVENQTLIQLKISNEMMHIVPLYINARCWLDEFERVRNLIFNNDKLQYLLVGDVNARVGVEQYLYCDDVDSDVGFLNSRKSRDRKVNKEGRKLLELCEDHGLIILNGRSEGDKEGEFTYISKVGCSVIDLGIVSLGIKDSIKDLEVGKQIFSDHMPLIIKVEVEREGVEDQCCQLLPKLIWKGDKLHQYKETLGKETEKVLKGKELTALEDLEKLKGLINKCYPTKNTGSFHFSKKQPWYDFECYNKRKRIFRLLNLFRISNSNVIRNAYLNNLKKYKELCKRKKEDYFLDICNKFEKARDSKGFWSLTNKFQQISKIRIGDIEPKIWKDYF